MDANVHCYFILGGHRLLEIKTPWFSRSNLLFPVKSQKVKNWQSHWHFLTMIIFLLKVKFTENKYPLSKISLSTFIPSASITMLIFKKLMLEYLYSLLSLALQPFIHFPLIVNRFWTKTFSYTQISIFFPWHRNLIFCHFHYKQTLIVWVLMTHQPLWVILGHLQRKGEKIEEVAEEMKERDREERGTWMKVKKQKK